MIHAISSDAREMDSLVTRRFLARMATTYEPRIMLFHKSAPRTYGEVAECVGERARTLTQMGVRGRVLLMLPSSDEFLYTVFALIEAGAVPVLLSPALPFADRDAIRADCASAWVVEPSGSAHAAKQLANGLSIVELPLGEAPTTRQPPPPDSSDCDAADAEALIYYTSGSTGRMKGVVHTLGSMLRNTYHVAATLGIRPDDRFLTSVPLSHSFGFCFGMLVAIASGASVASPEHLGAVGLLEQVEGQSISVLVCTSSLLRQLVAIAQSERLKLPSLRCVVVAGAPLPPSVADAAADAICPQILNFYGMTETGGIAVTRPDSPPERRTTTVGKAVSGVDLRIVDDGRQPLPVGSVGEIACRTDGLFREYLKMPDATHQVKDEAGWFYTGDAGYLDEAGYLTLTGRKDDLIIKQGFNVYPKEVDLVLSSHHAVAECVVVGIADDRLGQRIRAVVCPLPGSALSEKALRGYCAERLLYYKVPDEIVLVESIPRTPSGKVDLSLLRAVTWSPPSMPR